MEKPIIAGIIIAIVIVSALIAFNESIFPKQVNYEQEFIECMEKETGNTVISVQKCVPNEMKQTYPEEYINLIESIENNSLNETDRNGSENNFWTEAKRISLNTQSSGNNELNSENALETEETESLCNNNFVCEPELNEDFVNCINDCQEIPDSEMPERGECPEKGEAYCE
ncbi:MAG: hypothetical protein JW703_03870 [Candidatus Diapherotrites archaeon]|nr:hypothetical protein [Candidatus Diapherotrites archaeon]